MPRRRSDLRSTVRALLLVALTASVLSACGASSSSSTGATPAGTGAVSAPTSAELTARVKLATCLRTHGIQVSDPSPSGAPAGALAKLLAQLTQQYGPTKLQAAIAACRQYVATSFPRLTLTPSAKAQAERDVLAFARCMRSHGIDIPDPQPAGAGLGLQHALSGLNPSSPAFQRALTACNKLLPVRVTPS